MSKRAETPRAAAAFVDEDSDYDDDNDDDDDSRALGSLLRPEEEGERGRGRGSSRTGIQPNPLRFFELPEISPRLDEQPAASAPAFHTADDRSEPDEEREVVISTSAALNDEEDDEEKKAGDWERVPHWRLALFSAFWLGRSIYQSSVSIYLTQQQVSVLVPADQTETVFSAVGLISSLASMFLNPMFGSLSDGWRTRNRFGRRHPFLIIGALLHIVSLGGLAWLSTYTADNSSLQTISWVLPVLSLWLLLDSLFDSICMAPYSALILDYVPPSQFGAASGWMGLASMLGTIIGAVGTGLIIDSVGLPVVYLINLAFVLAGMLLTVVSNEPDKNRAIYAAAVAKGPPASSISPSSSVWQDVRILSAELLLPFKIDGFIWIFLSRFFFNMAFDVISSFFYFFLEDMVGAPYSFFGLFVIEDHGVAMALFMFNSLMGSVASSLLSGVLSDRFGRKVIIYLAVAAQCIATSTFLWTQNYGLVAGVMAPLAGAGYGAYVSVDWALAGDTLVSSDDFARNMGVWHLSSVTPDLIGLPFAAWLISHFNPIGDAHGISFLGHRLVFGLVIVSYFLAGVLVSPVRELCNIQPCLTTSVGKNDADESSLTASLLSTELDTSSASD